MADVPTPTDLRWVDLRAGRVLHEGGGLLALDKPAGWSVMGERHDTDLVRVAADAGVRLWPAHRIDKVTSGVVLFATELARHGDLTRQFAARTVDKTYLALTATTGLPARGRVELPLSVGRKNRVRIAAPREAITATAAPGETLWSVPDDAVTTTGPTYPSTTTFTVLAADERHTLLEVAPLTGAAAPDPRPPGLDRARPRRRPAVRPAPHHPHRPARLAARDRRPVRRAPAPRGPARGGLHRAGARADDGPQENAAAVSRRGGDDARDGVLGGQASASASRSSEAANPAASVTGT